VQIDAHAVRILLESMAVASRPAFVAGRNNAMMAIQRHLARNSWLVICAATMSAGCASEPSRIREIDEQAEPIFEKMCDALDGVVRGPIDHAIPRISWNGTDGPTCRPRPSILRCRLM